MTECLNKTERRQIKSLLGKTMTILEWIPGMVDTLPLIIWLV
jgi:hypothetical protein